MFITLIIIHRETANAYIKLMVPTKTYILQAYIHRLNQHKVSPNRQIQYTLYSPL